MASSRRQSFRARPLKINKSLEVLIRNDEIAYEDANGVRRVATAFQNSMLQASKRQKKYDIPAPSCSQNPTYLTDYPKTFKISHSYVRFKKPSEEKIEKDVQYNAVQADINWVKNHPIFGENGTCGQLHIDMFEKMIDMMEKFFYKQKSLTQEDAEHLSESKLNFRGPNSSKIIAEVRRYWLKRREEFCKPLLRQFWQQTSANDTDPHMVFRPRETERYKLRRQSKK